MQVNQNMASPSLHGKISSALTRESPVSQSGGAVERVSKLGGPTLAPADEITLAGNATGWSRVEVA